MTSITPILQKTYDWCNAQVPKEGILSATLMGISASIASIPFKALVTHYFSEGKPIKQEVVKKFTGDLLSSSPSIIRFNIFVIGFLGPFLEELFYRNLLQRNLLPSLFKRSPDQEPTLKEKAFCVLTSSALFAVTHYEKAAGLHANKAILASTFIGGVVYGSLAETTHSIYSSTVAHSTNNCMSMFRIYSALRKS
jgi:membrane protease YdiL (CAAX protease family)